MNNKRIARELVRLAKNISSEKFVDQWTKDIFKKEVGNAVVAIILNKKTNTLFGSEVYTEDVIEDVIEEAMRNKNIVLIGILPEKKFKQKYTIVKEVHGIPFNIIKEK